MEGLTKQQLLLLALLISFVTSIATGIVTVSLVNQAPPAITQTINRVVEKTVERVVPSANQAAIVTKETVVVKEGDQVVKAVEENAKSVIRIRKIVGVGQNRDERFAGLGLVVSKSGLIISDTALLTKAFDESGSPIPQSFLGIAPNGSLFALKVVGVDAAGEVVLFAPAGEDVAGISFVPARIGDANAVKLGQTVVAISGEESNSVATGIVASLSFGETADPKDAKRPVMLITTDEAAASGILGTILLNLSGEIIGLKIGPSAGERKAYLPATLLEKSIVKITTEAGVRRN